MLLLGCKQAVLWIFLLITCSKEFFFGRNVLGMIPFIGYKYCGLSMFFIAILITSEECAFNITEEIERDFHGMLHFWNRIYRTSGHFHSRLRAD